MPRYATQFSPPAPLPTPLPELPLLAPEPLPASSGLNNLIDFDDRQFHSPPYREAQLPDEYDEYEEREDTPPPLPIPPRIHNQAEDIGHTRTPTLPSSPTRLESLSRTIMTYTPHSASAALRSSADVLRTYVPAGIRHIPSVAPSPPMVSRPLSYGRFSVEPELSHSPYPREDNDFEYRHEAYAHAAPSGVSRALSSSGSGSDHLKKDADDTIAWALWDVLSQRRVLIVGYTTGIQIWDCRDLGSVLEILNLTVESEEWVMDVGGRTIGFNNFVRARVLQSPLLGVLLSDSSGHSAFFIYSLHNHQIEQRIALPGIASTFESNQHFIIITTTSPPTVHILSSTTFHTLWTLSSASLATTTQGSIVSYLPHPSLLEQHPQPPPVPVIALSNRLLAYASPPPPTTKSRRISSASSPGTTGSGVPSVSSSPFQSELGNAAIKVGGSVLSGMKFLGGIALEAAKNKISESKNVEPVVVGKFVSRSAPEERGFSVTPDKVVTPFTNPILESGYYVTVLDLDPLLDDAKPVKVCEFMTSKSQPVAQLAFSSDGCKLVSVPENGQVTRVFALRPRPGDAEERKVGDGVRLYDLRRGRTSAEVEGVDSTRDGRWVAIGTKNRTVHVFPTNPLGGRPDLVGHLKGRVRNVDELQPSLVEVAPIIRLRPLRSSKTEQPRAPLAFAFINPGDVTIPTGLLPSQHKHVGPTPSPQHTALNHPRRTGGANVQDILVFDPSTGMLSLRRILTDQRPKDQLQLGNLASVSNTAMGVVSRSLPGTVGSPIRLSASPGSVSRAPSTSASTGGGQAEVAMELVGRGEVMAMWDLQRKRDWKEIRKSVSVGGISRDVVHGPDWLSLAELSTCSRSSRILPRSLYLSHQFSFWSFGEDYHALLRQYQFDVRGSKIHVRREVQVSIGVGLNSTSDRFVVDDNNNNPALDNFYRSSPTNHHPHQSGGGGGSTSTSFDEPLASALAGDLVTDYHTTYASSVPPILPMYPNGVPGSTSSAAAFIRNAIPIRRGLGDGAINRMSEGIGRIGTYYSSRQKGTAAVGESPLGGEREEHGSSVPLEFDEEDEDFLGVARVMSRTGEAAGAAGMSGTSVSALTGISSGTSDGVVLPPTPEEVINLNEVSEGEEVLWKGWESREVGQTVEEVERFDDISVVGFLDEEHQAEVEAVRVRERERVAAAAVATGVGKKKGKKGKGRR